MKAKLSLLVLLFIILVTQSLQAQFGFSHEIGVITGPVAFQSDYGQRSDFETNSGNVGFGIGIVHYLNFAYKADCNCYAKYSYFNDHFKVRNEIDYHVTNFDHFGDEVGEDSFGGFILENHKGSTKVFEIGSQLEYFPLSIRDFTAGAYKFSPYVSLGVHFVTFDPDATTELGNGDIFSQVSTPFGEGPALLQAFAQGDGEFNSGIDRRAGSTWAITWSAGTRYKLSALSDLLLDFRWHYYTSNWVDGFNPDPRPSNRADDWIFWVNVGYIYYLD